MIRVVLPFHLQKLAKVEGEVQLDLAGPVTQRAILDALEARYPVLRGTIRDHVSKNAVPSCASSPANRTFPTIRPILPSRCHCHRRESFVVLGAMAGG